MSITLPVPALTAAKKPESLLKYLLIQDVTQVSKLHTPTTTSLYHQQVTSWWHTTVMLHSEACCLKIAQSAKCIGPQSTGHKGTHILRVGCYPSCYLQLA